MPRQIVVGNGTLTVALDSHLQIRDFMFPFVGLENHSAGHALRLGVWVDGTFSWMGNAWDISAKYLPETLVSKCVAINKDLSLELEINDAVHSFSNIYLRKIAVKNMASSKREIRVFLSHDFHIYGEDSADTVLYEPQTNGMIHYKRKRYFLANGLTEAGKAPFEYAAGQKEAFGKEGTWKDAEDGVLTKNPIAQGSVDSTVSFSLEVEPKASSIIYYWIACGENLQEVKVLDLSAKRRTVEQLLLETENYWSAWINKQNLNLNVLPKEISRMFKSSLLIMRSHVDNHGGIISSCDSDVLQFNRDTYSYVWPRDAAICAIAFDMAGFQGVSELFFQFCDRTISDEGYFRHKYWTDGSVGSSWHPLIASDGKEQLPIQLDETALVVYALWRHFQRFRDLEFISRVYPRLVLKAIDFMQKYRDPLTGLPKPSFEIWEEKAGVFTSTAACVSSALASAAKFARVFYDRSNQENLETMAIKMKQAIRAHLFDEKEKRFVKAINLDGSKDLTIDSSLAFTFLTETFGPDGPEVVQTMEAVAKHLWIDPGIGGIARYQNDNYHRVSNEVPGNPWIICTLWLARWHISTAQNLEDLRKAMDILRWVVKYSSPSGLLAEQLNPFDATPISVSPLIWSHAEFVIAVCEYMQKHQQLSPPV